MVDGIVRNHLRRATEQVPVKSLGNAVYLLRRVETLGPDGPVRSAFHFGDLSDLTVPYPFAHQVGALVRSPLVAHLRSHVVLFGQLGQQAGLIYRVGQRLLAIHVLAHGQRFGRDDGMGVVGRSHQDRIDALAHFIIHLAVIIIPLGVGKTLENRLGITPVHVAQGHDIIRLCHVFQIGITHASDTYSRDVQLVTGRDMPETLAQNAARGDGQAGQGGSACLEKISS